MKYVYFESAAEMAAAASKPYHDESSECREACTALLAEGIELRRHIARVGDEAVARGVPVNGLCWYPVTDYPGWDDGRVCPTACSRALTSTATVRSTPG